MRKLVDITDYFLLVTGGNRRQTQSIAEEISDVLEREGKSFRMEGLQLGWWIVLDAGAVVIHVLQDEARKFYGLDHLWADAPEIQMIRKRSPKKALM